MPKKTSAGILFYRYRNGELEFFLIHPGGPLFRGRDEGFWSIPKGEPDNKDEDLRETAMRETMEETGITAERAALIPLGSIIQKGGKEVFAWACPYSGPETPAVKSNSFTMEWPPRSGIRKSYPEVDDGRFFTYTAALEHLKDRQVPLLDRLKIILSEKGHTP